MPGDTTPVNLGTFLKAMESHRQKPPNSPSKVLAKNEAEDFEKEAGKHYLKQLQLNNDALEEIIKLRGDYSGKIFKFLIWWSGGVGVVLACQGFNIWGFDLPESVLDLLVGSTTANVIALVGLVVKGLFPKTAK